MYHRIVKSAGALLGALAGLFGQWNIMLTVLVWLMAFDYITGLVCAAMGKSPKTTTGGLSSHAGFEGLLRKGVIMLVVLTATLLDRATGTDSALFQTAATGYYIANEGISILENSALMGVPYPRILLRALEEMRARGDEVQRDNNGIQGNDPCGEDAGLNEKDPSVGDTGFHGNDPTGGDTDLNFDAPAIDQTRFPVNSIKNDADSDSENPK